jgi:hypothetical protein
MKRFIVRIQERFVHDQNSLRVKKFHKVQVFSEYQKDN